MKQKSAQQRKSKKLAFLFFAVILIVLYFSYFNSRQVIKIENIRWSSSEQLCTVSFKAKNTTEQTIECIFQLRAFDYVHTHDREYEKLGEKELRVEFQPNEIKTFTEKIEIQPTFKAIRIQVSAHKIHRK